jgi:type IV pilus assembly protein PilW
VSRGRRPRRPAGAREGAGFGLVELLVAMAIGLAVLAAVLTATLQARRTYAALETTARLQETARHALGVIESDVRMSGHLGLLSRAEAVSNLRGPLTDPRGQEVPLTGCSAHWATDLARPLTGWDHTLDHWPFDSGCRPNGGWRSGTDVLVVRRASADRIAQSAAALREFRGHVLLATSRTAGRVFVGDALGTVPAGFAESDPPDAPPLADTRRLLVHAYYVSPASSESPALPSLRRKRLVSGPSVQDEELLPGVEDLQVRYGVDADGDLAVDRYVDADGLADGDRVVAARIWLRVRSAERDVAWDDRSRYLYANQDEQLPDPERPFRRVVVSRTVQVRNAGLP